AALPGETGHRAEATKEAAFIQLINAYRVRAHLIADLDPLGVEPSYHPELDPSTYGLTIWDLDREFLTGSLGEAIGEGAPQPVATLREILETLRRTYCGKVGVEYMNIQHPREKRWLQQRMEPDANHQPLEKPVRVEILKHLMEAEEFEHFLHARLGRRQISSRRERRAIHAIRPRSRGFHGAESEPSGGCGSGCGGHRAPEAGPPGRRGARARDTPTGPRRRGIRRAGRGG